MCPGTFALDGIFNPVLTKLMPGFLVALPGRQFSFLENRESALSNLLAKVGFTEPVTVSLKPSDMLTVALCSVFGIWYGLKKHWCANNLIGAAFSVRGIEMFSVGSYKIGCILLAGLFFYDIFWVFGTDALIAKVTGKTGEGVMVTVAKNFNAPIKLLFPREWGLTGSALAECSGALNANITATLLNTSIVDFPAAMLKLGVGNETAQPLISAAAESAEALTDALSLAADKLIKVCSEHKMSMLGLGDIVIPGIFVALLLRFDQKQADEAGRALKKTCFNFTFAGYVLGLATTVYIMVVFEAAQPALLYLVPGCIGMSCLAGLLQGSFSQMWNYTEHDEQEEEKKSGDEEPEKKQD